MECFICHNKGSEKLIPTLCGCTDMVAHISCVKEYGRVNPNKDNKLCSQCNRRFNGELLYRLISENRRNENEISETSEIAIPISEIPEVVIPTNENRRGWKFSKWLIVTIFAILSSFALYVFISYFLVDKYYSQPKEIKNNQIETVCNVTDITYEFNRDYVKDEKIITEYKITKAYGDFRNVKNINMLKLVEHIRCEICSNFILTECVIYIKNDKLIYLAVNKDNIEKKFDASAYVAFITLVGFVWMIFSIAFLAVHFLDLN